MARRKSLSSFLVTRNSFKRLGILFLLMIVALFWCHCTMIHMPGQSFRGSLPPVTPEQSALAEDLRRDVVKLAGEIAQRNVFYPEGLKAAADHIEEEMKLAGYEVKRLTYEVMGVASSNLEVEIKGAARPDEIVIIGAHYDSVDQSPAANDNGSGVAATLALARRFATSHPQRTVRFVLFVNEEPPFFLTQDMGSLVYAKRCKERGENVVAMISLETIGCYRDEPGSQTYPIKPIGLFYPDVGNFIAFVGNFSSRKLVRQSIKSFRQNAQFPSEGAAMPEWIAGVNWSDHWSFWQAGYPAIMVTDTALFRYPHYHSIHDTPEKLDYERMARVVEGMEAVVDHLVNSDS